jgi:hypothetical protein
MAEEVFGAWNGVLPISARDVERCKWFPRL